MIGIILRILELFNVRVVGIKERRDVNGTGAGSWIARRYICREETHH